MIVPQGTATGRAWPATKPGAPAEREREAQAVELGRALANAMGDPARFAARLDAAFAALADPAYREGQELVAPGIGPTHGVRSPLQVAVRKAFEHAVRLVEVVALLSADRLLR